MVEETPFAVADRQAAWDEYERWLATKRADTSSGAWIIGGSVLTSLVLLVLSKGQGFGPIQSLIGFVLTGVTLWGTSKIVKAKGRNPAFVLLGLCGIFAFLALGLEDHNRLEAPSTPGSGIKPEGSDFSDW